MDDEMDELRDELASVRAENERLQSEAAEAEARMRELMAGVSTLRSQLAEATSQRDALGQELAGAVTRFREAVLASEPDVPADLVAGNSIEEVVSSLSAARQTVEQIRERIASEAGDVARVPTGAPVRHTRGDAPLSSRDKIAEGLRRSQG